jgi:hypothetical protein
MVRLSTAACENITGDRGDENLFAITDFIQGGLQLIDRIPDLILAHHYNFPRKVPPPSIFCARERVSSACLNFVAELLTGSMTTIVLSFFLTVPSCSAIFSMAESDRTHDRTTNP